MTRQPLFFLMFACFFIACKQKETSIIVSAVKKSRNHFADLSQAIEASRKIDPGRTKHILIENGEYFLKETILLDQRDSNLIIETGVGEKPVLIGGIELENWKWEDKFLVANIAKNPDFRMLEVNGRLAERARFPDSGYFHHLTKCDLKWLSTLEGGWSPKPSYEQLRSLEYNPKDLPAGIDLAGAEITVMHMWDETLVKVSGRDTDNNRLIFNTAVAWPPGGWNTDRYVIWNINAGMSRPGQWYLNRTESKVYYWPLENEGPENIKAIVPVLDRIFRIENTGNIQIKGLTLKSTGSQIMVGGFGAKWFDGAISMDHVSECLFSGLEIFNVSTHGIKGNGQHITIRDCHLHHTGAAGIRFIGSHSEIADNHIHDVGLIYPSAIALYVNVTDPNATEEWEAWKDEGHMKIMHNRIHDVPYTALACGGNSTEISGNRIYNAMKVLGDGSGIYITFCNNLILRNNFLSDIDKGRGFGTSAYYLDELTDNALVEGNLSINVSRPLHAHLSKGNMIRNNIFIVEEGDARITLPRCKDFSFEKNIFMAAGSIHIEGVNVLSTFNQNILHSQNGDIRATDLPLNQKDRTPSNVRIYDLPADNTDKDPLIKNYKDGKIVFEDLSPAVKYGIEAIDVR